ncbi:GL14319 [Drosophila persimilis]|uniref:GL14319 n=1 Tax=Drosophila persimilis TaxID=7234 RepID=B4GTC3_DROPE|nr:GL14319 [Drosophila persimilis]
MPEACLQQQLEIGAAEGPGGPPDEEQQQKQKQSQNQKQEEEQPEQQEQQVISKCPGWATVVAGGAPRLGAGAKQNVQDTNKPRQNRYDSINVVGSPT